jgi:protein-S-isoprenylcysteine O-methyltransferase Ste14
MNLFPEFSLTWMNGFLLMIPLLGLRYGIPAVLRKEALAELDYFPPVQGKEKIALKGYFITNTILIFSPITASIKLGTWNTKLGLVIYLLGIGIMSIALAHYCKQPGLKISGIYKHSRNPMCVGYFLIFVGASLLIGSWFHLVLTLFVQITVHGLILSEERWCRKQFPQQYANYLACTPRYF